MYYIAVCEYEESETIEIPVENDDTVLLTTLGGIFPNVCGLKYRAPETNTYRALKLSDGKFYRPVEGWQSLKFYCVFPKDNNKRKIDEEAEKPMQKSKRLEGRKCTDLIVLNLGWKVDEEILRKYFSKYGELVLVQVKKDRETSHSKGYAFIRFCDYESQVLCLAEKHLIDGRWCAVKVPFSKNEADKQEISKKIHVGYASEDISMEDLRQAFEQYGYVTDIFIPKPFRNFAFVTFDSSDAAQSLIGQSISILGHTLTIGSAVPKINSNRNKGGAMQAHHFSMYHQQQHQHHQQQQQEAAAASMLQPYQTRYAPGMIPTYGAAWPPSYDIAAAQKAAARANSNAAAAAAAAYGTYQGMMGSGGSSGQYMVANGNGGSGSSSSRAAGQEALQQGGYASQQELMQQQQYLSQQQQQQQQYVTDAGQQGSAASTALNILNNPDVVAAIVAAASKSSGSAGKYKREQK